MKVKRFVVHDSVLKTLLTQGLRTDVVQGVPDSARIVSTSWDPTINSIHISFQHDSFPDVVPGGVIPMASGVFIHQPTPNSESPEAKPVCAGGLMEREIADLTSKNTALLVQIQHERGARQADAEEALRQAKVDRAEREKLAVRLCTAEIELQSAIDQRNAMRRERDNALSLAFRYMRAAEESVFPETTPGKLAVAQMVYAEVSALQKKHPHLSPPLTKPPQGEVKADSRDECSCAETKGANAPAAKSPEPCSYQFPLGGWALSVDRNYILVSPLR